jgi:hypothetical protein
LGNLAKGIVMSVLFLAGMVLYGSLAIGFMPDIGPIVGWPVFLAATIIAANALGVLSGEWKGCDRGAFTWLYGGIALLIVACTLTGVSNLYKPEAASSPEKSRRAATDFPSVDPTTPAGADRAPDAEPLAMAPTIY